MTRAILPALAAGLLVAVACSRPAPEGAAATPAPAATATPATPLVVGVVVGAKSGPDAEAWAKELRAAVGAHADELRLAADDGRADLVVRIESVQRHAKFKPEPPGDGEAILMRGTLVLGERTREFTLGYRGEARPQAEALARNLRPIAKDMSGAPEPSPGASPKPLTPQ